MKLSQNFKKQEFDCKCGNCTSPEPNIALVAVLDLVREHFGAPVIITSGYRCPTHNKAIGGAEHSRHMDAIAADFKVVGVEPELVYNYLNNHYRDRFGLGLYKSWVHLDVRANKARW